MSVEVNTDQLLAAWVREERKRKKRRRILTGVSLGFLLVPCLVYAVWYWGHTLHGWGEMPVVWRAIVLLLPSFSGIVGMPTLFLSKAYNGVVRNLAGIKDICAIGPLLEALAVPH